jgi:hypothetical protein
MIMTIPILFSQSIGGVVPGFRAKKWLPPPLQTMP